MADNKNIVKTEDITCKYCNKVFEIPILLNCGHSICREHLPSSNNQISTVKNEFECKDETCRKISQLDSKAYVFNKTMDSLIKLYQKCETPKYDFLMKKINSFEKSNQFLINDTETRQVYISDYFNDIKIDVERNFMILIEKMEFMYKSLCKQIEKCEQTCQENLKNVDTNQKFERNMHTILKWKELARKPGFNQQDQNELEKEINEFETNIELDVFECKSKLLCDKSYVFEPNYFENLNENIIGSFIEKQLELNEEEKIEINDACGIIDENSTKTNNSSHKNQTGNGQVLSSDLQDLSIQSLLTARISNSQLHEVASSLWSSNDFDGENNDYHDEDTREYDDGDDENGINHRNNIDENNNETLQEYDINVKRLNDLDIHDKSVHVIKHISNDVYVSGSFDGMIIFWRYPNLKEIAKIEKAHGAAVECLELTSDKRKLISGSWDFLIKLWLINDLENMSKTPLATFQGHTSHIWSLKIMNNDSVVLSASSDGSIKVWSLKDEYRCIKTIEQIKTGKKVDRRYLPGHRSCVHCLTKTIDDRFLISSSEDNTIKIWDAHDNFNFVRSLMDHKKAVYMLDIMPNGNLISSSIDCTLKIWQLDHTNGNDTVLKTFKSKYKIYCHKYLPGGFLFIGRENEASKFNLKFFEIKSDRVIKEYECNSHNVEYSLETGYLFSCTRLNNRISVFKIEYQPKASQNIIKKECKF